MIDPIPLVAYLLIQDSGMNLNHLTMLLTNCRKKRESTKNDARDEKSNSPNSVENKVYKTMETLHIENKASEYTEIHDVPNKDDYFVLKPPNPNPNVADGMNGNCSSPYIDTEEGDYDHLRGTKSRQKEADDTYNHALPVHADDSSDYDVTRRKCEQETENMYDKTGGNNSDSEYGYTSNKVLSSNEENPYDKTSATS
jgi:hypothetical protein